MTHKNVASGVVHQVPADLAGALTSDSKVLAVWEDITPLARNEWICWVLDAKKPETRQRRIEVGLSKLKSGMRRPCCWSGCIHRTDKEISPSVRGILLKKQRRDAR